MLEHKGNIDDIKVYVNNEAEGLTFKLIKQRIKSKILKRSKYVKTKWYQFFAYTFPFYYVFVLLEKLKLVHRRPYRIDKDYEVVTINGLGEFADSFLIEAINEAIEEQKGNLK